MAAAVPFYGPRRENPTFAGTTAAVLGDFAGKDARVDAAAAAQIDDRTLSWFEQHLV